MRKESREMPAAIDELDIQKSKAESRKIIENGRLLILHGDKAYTITGVEIR